MPRTVTSQKITYGEFSDFVQEKKLHISPTCFINKKTKTNIISDNNKLLKNRCLLFFQTIRRPEGQLETKLAEAELRRKELQEEKVTKVMEHSGLERHGRMRSASTNRYIRC